MKNALTLAVLVAAFLVACPAHVRVIRRTMRGMFLYGSRGMTVVFGAKLIAGHLFRMGI